MAPAYRELVDFVRFVTGKFFKKIQTYPLLYVDVSALMSALMHEGALSEIAQVGLAENSIR